MHKKIGMGREKIGKVTKVEFCVEKLYTKMSKNGILCKGIKTDR